MLILHMEIVTIHINNDLNLIYVYLFYLSYLYYQLNLIELHIL